MQILAAMKDLLHLYPYTDPYQIRSEKSTAETPLKNNEFPYSVSKYHSSWKYHFHHRDYCLGGLQH